MLTDLTLLVRFVERLGIHTQRVLSTIILKWHTKCGISESGWARPEGDIGSIPDMASRYLLYLKAVPYLAMDQTIA